MEIHGRFVMGLQQEVSGLLVGRMGRSGMSGLLRSGREIFMVQIERS